MRKFLEWHKNTQNDGHDSDTKKLLEKKKKKRSVKQEHFAILPNEELHGRISIPDMPPRGVMEQLRKLNYPHTQNMYVRVKGLHERFTRASIWINKQLEAGTISLEDSAKSSIKSSMEKWENSDKWLKTAEIEGQPLIRTAVDDIVTAAFNKTKLDPSAKTNLEALVEDIDDVQGAIGQSLKERNGIAFASSRPDRHAGEKRLCRITEKAEDVAMEILKVSNPQLYEHIYEYLEIVKATHECIMENRDNYYSFGISTFAVCQQLCDQKYRKFRASLLPAIEENNIKGPAYDKLTEHAGKIYMILDTLIKKGKKYPTDDSSV